MLGIRLLHKNQPSPKKKVLEFTVYNLFGKWMNRRGWGAFTLPFCCVVIILYWVSDGTKDPDPASRYHEFVHVGQDEENLIFLVTWWHYFVEWLRHGYWNNKYEIAAYARTNLAKKNGLPSWTHTDRT
jgi:hypothetical protein